MGVGVDGNPDSRSKLSNEVGVPADDGFLAISALAFAFSAACSLFLFPAVPAM